MYALLPPKSYLASKVAVLSLSQDNIWGISPISGYRFPRTANLEGSLHFRLKRWRRPYRLTSQGMFRSLLLINRLSKQTTISHWMDMPGIYLSEHWNTAIVLRGFDDSHVPSRDPR